MFSSDLPISPTKFTFLPKMMIMSKIGEFLTPQMLMIEKKNTYL